MSKYTNVDEAREALRADFCENFLYDIDEYETVLGFLDSLPSADVVEVKHGHWELDGTCSVCGKHTLQSYGNFCCYCGADMNGNTSNRGETECPAYLPRTISNTIDVNTIITDDTTNNLVEVVRCKDCRYRTPQPDDERDCCDLTYSAISNNDFCSYGERKTDE